MAVKAGKANAPFMHHAVASAAAQLPRRPSSAEGRPPAESAVGLPLMGKGEAGTLLLDLANVEEDSYLKEHPGSTFPPDAAREIAAECGQLPITLLIAAQILVSDEQAQHALS